MLLVVRGCDCYVAICKHLHYLTNKNQWVCVLLVLLSCVGGFPHDVVQLLFIYNLPFCGPNVTDHFIYDMYTLLKFACTDTYIIGLTVVANDKAMCVIIFMLLSPMGSFCTPWKSQSGTEQQTLSTCGSHIAVLVLFLLSCIFMYMRPPSSLPIDKSLTVFCTIITPLLNPVIYTMRNGEMKIGM